MGPPGLIGRAPEQERLGAAVAEAAAGRGSLVLVCGEAGVGKSRLVDGVLADSGLPLLRGAGTADAPVPYGPLVEALRCHLRADPDSLMASGPFGDRLALLLPELGPTPAQVGPAEVAEAVHGALAAIGRRTPFAVVLDDLQWSDEATLDLLRTLAETVRGLPALVVGVYRSDGLPPDHSLRRLRDDLRRAGMLTDIRVAALDRAETAQLVERGLEALPAPGLVDLIFDRTQGVPFFVEELTGALAESGDLVDRGFALDLAPDVAVPVPETVRDAVLLRLAALSEDARALADRAAVAGLRFQVDEVAGTGGEGAFAELAAVGVVVHTGPDPEAQFRHALVRGAILEAMPWARRRSLHSAAAEALEARDGSAAEIAAHWLAAGAEEPARAALLRALEEFAALRAYRDAAQQGRRALALLTAPELREQRRSALPRYASCSELAGELPAAAQAWRELATLARADEDAAACAAARSALARVHDLSGERERGYAARLEAASDYARAGLFAAAARERLLAGGYLQGRGEHSEALALARQALSDADAADDPGLSARARGLEGLTRAKRGDVEEGVAIIREALSDALARGLSVEAAEIYQRLASALEVAADYREAREALDTALGLCRTGSGVEYACQACMAYVLLELGAWPECTEVSESIIADADAGAGNLAVGEFCLGAIAALRGDARPARRLLTSALESSRRIRLLSIQVLSRGALAFLEEQEGAPDDVADHCRALLEVWAESEDHHYAVRGLRFAAVFLAEHGQAEEAQRHVDALARISAATGQPDALAALAHALGELALLRGEVDAAAAQLEQAVELHRGIEIPDERAQILLRAGLVLARAGRREQGVELLVEAHRISRRLGARPLTARAADALQELGEPLVRRVGRRAADAHEGAGLSRREQEVLRRVAAGATNREIAGELVLSTRTVDAHVRSILTKLGCKSRAEAVARAGGLGLLAAVAGGGDQ